MLANFNLRGAARIGFGMAPRCEVALIIAGIGLSAHLLDGQLSEIQVFDPDGEYVQSLGKQGDGPGEVRRATEILFIGPLMIAATLLIALSMHLNYLMGILWGPWLVTIWMAHMNGGPTARKKNTDPPTEPNETNEAPWTVIESRRGVFGQLFSGRLLVVMLIGSVASTAAAS